MNKLLFCFGFLVLMLASSFSTLCFAADPNGGEALKMMEVVEGPFVSMKDVKAKYKDGLPDGFVMLPTMNSKAKTSYFVLKSEPVISTIDVMDARLESMEGRAPAIGVTLSDAGAVKLGVYTESNIGKRLAIVLFGKVTSTPVIRAKISKNALITGHFTREEAEKVLKQLRVAMSAEE